MKRVVKHELIEVIVPAGSTATRFQLPDAQNLRNVQTWWQAFKLQYRKRILNVL